MTRRSGVVQSQHVAGAARPWRWAHGPHRLVVTKRWYWFRHAYSVKCTCGFWRFKAPGVSRAQLDGVRLLAANNHREHLYEVDRFNGVWREWPEGVGDADRRPQ